MLMQLGLVQFETAPLNLSEYNHEIEASFATKEVLGRRPPLEFVGRGPESFTFSGKIYPLKWALYLGDTGIDQLNRLLDAQGSGIAQVLVRGDGTFFGWFVIEKVTEKSTFLDRTGVGQIMDFEITLKRADAPTVDDFVGQVTSPIANKPGKRRPSTTVGPAPGAKPSSPSPVGRDPDAFRTDL